MDIMPFVWLALMVVFLLIEAATVTVLSLWFAVGSLAALVTAMLGGAVWAQNTVFLAVSIVLLALLRPLTKRYFSPRLTATNVDSVIGSTGWVTADIDNITAQGQVKLGSMEWSARSTSGEPIPAGTQIRADRVEGVKVFVSPLEIPEKV